MHPSNLQPKCRNSISDEESIQKTARAKKKKNDVNSSCKQKKKKDKREMTV